MPKLRDFLLLRIWQARQQFRDIARIVKDPVAQTCQAKDRKGEFFISDLPIHRAGVFPPAHQPGLGVRRFIRSLT